MDFSEFETRMGGTWQIGGCTDYWSKLELGWHVRERAFGSLKYEHLYRLEIDDGHDLAAECETYRQLFNTIRPHQSLAGRRPLDAHLDDCQTVPTPKLSEPETLPPS